ncbi:MAG: nucleotidyltransferase domain-containing protein [Nocardioidaceae bacterium]|jgi:lincosamide nucleotidyltransferase A/C/D/E
MTEYAMPPETVRTLIAALEARGVAVCVGGGWAIDALVGEVTRKHSDLDIWVDAAHTEGLFAGLADQGVDRIHPWPGDRPWNFVVGDGHSRRVDLHLYESLGDGRLHYGSVNTPFLFTTHDLSGDGDVGGMRVQCESPEFALQNHTGYALRDIDRHDVAVLCQHFGLPAPEDRQ